MSRFGNLTAGDFLRVVQRLGFVVVRVRGSHHFVRHPDGRTTVVAVHSGDTTGPGLLAKMLRDVGLTRDELTDLL